MELGLDKGTPISEHDVHERAKSARFEVLDEICQRYNLSAFGLSRRTADDLAHLVKTIRPAMQVNPDVLPAYVQEYLQAKR